MTIKIVLDSGSDIPSTWIDQDIMKIVPLTVIDSNKGIEYKDYFDLSKEELYKNMREGTVYKTSQPSPESFYTVFKEEIEKGNIVLCLTISSGISGTYQSAQIAHQTLKDEHNGDNVHIFDTKGASGGISLIAIKLQKYIDQGHSLDEVFLYTQFLIENINSLFCADDLVYLYRGGRISKATKMVTGVLDIKPAMRINKENGKLESYDKARGETKVYKLLTKTMLEDSSKENLIDQEIYIYHSDSEEKAQKMKNIIRKEIGAEHVFISEIGCTIGAHTGPGTIAIFYLTKIGDYGI